MPAETPIQLGSFPHRGGATGKRKHSRGTCCLQFSGRPSSRRRGHRSPNAQGRVACTGQPGKGLGDPTPYPCYRALNHCSVSLAKGAGWLIETRFAQPWPGNPFAAESGSRHLGRVQWRYKPHLGLGFYRWPRVATLWVQTQKTKVVRPSCAQVTSGSEGPA